MYTRMFTINIPAPQVTVERYQPKHLAVKPKRHISARQRKKHAEDILNRAVNMALSFAIIFAIAVCFSSASVLLSRDTNNAIMIPTAKAVTNEYKTHYDNVRTEVTPMVTSVPKTDMPVNMWQSMEIPAFNSGQKTFMDYRAITDTTSRQYKLQQTAYTNEIGLRCYDNCYMVAMGTYYGDVGDRFQITFASGETITAIMGDIKDDKHTDTKHQHRDGNIVEFIVDSKMLPEEVWYHGDISYLDNIFEGKVISIKKLVTDETGL